MQPHRRAVMEARTQPRTSPIRLPMAVTVRFSHRWPAQHRPPRRFSALSFQPHLQQQAVIRPREPKPWRSHCHLRPQTVRHPWHRHAYRPIMAPTRFRQEPSSAIATAGIPREHLPSRSTRVKPSPHSPDAMAFRKRRCSTQTVSRRHRPHVPVSRLSFHASVSHATLRALRPTTLI